MRISSETLVAPAEATGFRPDMLEKVKPLLQLLDAFRSHPFLKNKLVLSLHSVKAARLESTQGQQTLCNQLSYLFHIQHVEYLREYDAFHLTAKDHHNRDSDSNIIEIIQTSGADPKE